MTPAAKDLFDFLLADLEADQDTTFATNLLTQAKAKIEAGEGHLGMINNASLNGKTFSRQIVCTALDVARAARAALNAYDEDVDSEPTGITFLDLSRM